MKRLRKERLFSLLIWEYIYIFFFVSLEFDSHPPSPKSVQRMTISLETTATPVGCKLADTKFDSNHPPKVCSKTDFFDLPALSLILTVCHQSLFKERLYR